MKEYNFKINGADYNVVINSTEGNIANVSVNGVSYQVEIGGALPAAVPIQTVPTQAVQPEPAVPTSQAAAAVHPAPSGKVSGDGKPVTAPIPGVIVEISVKEGDSVSAGQKVAVLEAMKMENEILAESAGTVTKIHVAKGDSVQGGAAIVSIA